MGVFLKMNVVSWGVQATVVNCYTTWCPKKQCIGLYGCPINVHAANVSESVRVHGCVYGHACMRACMCHVFVL